MRRPSDSDDFLYARSLTICPESDYVGGHSALDRQRTETWRPLERAEGSHYGERL